MADHARGQQHGHVSGGGQYLRVQVGIPLPAGQQRCSQDSPGRVDGARTGQSQPTRRQVRRTQRSTPGIAEGGDGERHRRCFRRVGGGVGPSVSPAQPLPVILAPVTLAQVASAVAALTPAAVVLVGGFAEAVQVLPGRIELVRV